MQNIVTDRLILRNFAVTDAAGLLEYTANPRVNCFMDHQMSTLEEAIAEVEKRSKDDSHIAVCLKDSNEIIGELFGMTEGHDPDPDPDSDSDSKSKSKSNSDSKSDPDTYSVGWNFNGRFEGKGYASESARAFMEYLFMEQGIRRIYAYVEDDNFRSQKLCEKLGMRREGLFLEFISFVKNEDGTPKYENTYQYAILKKEWLAQQATAK
ncbi:GNAT family N-acetyltransferase [Paenibacillus polysaccharolyticus]|uniref:GNAT family N-acetyltransferase n=1 Tax=Paenibacillus polysaccharolyticus TaxID=582692 RepID=UPI00203AB2C5|nr:GNAT family N-acetyltransferase [Paenibacillus polysaccharolyticus]MCM3135760.1 GNAT family N-acetyltransferase [Paenibacillus polysaccharolyticus]